MEERIEGDGVAGLVEAEGFLIRDRRGHKRMLVGVLSGSESCVGLAIYDEDGSERASLLLDETGPVLGFGAQGDVRLLVGVDDRGTAAAFPGPYLVAMDRDGREAWRVHVSDDEGLVCRPSCPTAVAAVSTGQRAGLRRCAVAVVRRVSAALGGASRGVSSATTAVSPPPARVARCRRGRHAGW